MFPDSQPGFARPTAVRARAFLALFVTLTVTGFARAGADSDSATLYLADGNHRPVVLRSLTPGEIVLGREAAERVATADAVRLEFDNHSAPPSGAALIQLANGDRIVAGLSSMNGESMVALWKSYPDLPPVQIPAAAVAGILVSVPDDVVDKTRAFRAVFGHREKNDTVLLVNGDRLAGDLASFDQASLKLSQAGKTLQIELPRVRGIAFSSELTSLPPPHKPRILVTLSDGSQLTGWDASREPGGPLRLSSVLASTLELPIADVAAIRFLDGRATYLSDLQPAATRLAPYFGAATNAPPGHDQNAAGGPLVVRGHDECKGLGTRSESRLTYELDGRYRTFVATAAIDDFARGKGSARFAVDVDGARVWTSALVTGNSRPVAVGPIDVAGKHRLTLVVEYGELADVDDWVDWCDAIVIR